MTFTVAGETELDFVAPLPQPYKKTAVRIATVASVQNDALRDMVKTSGGIWSEENKLGVLGKLSQLAASSFHAFPQER